MLIIPATVAPYPKEAALPGAARGRCQVPMMIDTGARFSLVTDTVLGAPPTGRPQPGLLLGGPAQAAVH